ncbi:MAG: RNA polymerase sigma factor [Tissierellia bacterium]|nr:RNA polymerase sigma factor [Tissierellia bacterium]
MAKSREMEELINSLGDSLWTFCLRLTCNKYEAEDLYQDTMVKALELKDEIDFNQNPRAYIYSLAISINKNRFRKVFRRKKIAPIFDYDLNTLEDYGENVESQVIQSQEKKIIDLAISKLNEGQRAVILMYYMEELPIRDISKYLNIPEGTVKSRLNTGRKILKKELEGEEYE